MSVLTAIHREARMVIRAAQTLERTGIVDAAEFGRLLGVFATVVAEAEPDAGDILALWAGAVRDSQPPATCSARP